MTQPKLNIADLNKKTESIYKQAIKILKEGKVDFLVAGGFAVWKYTGYHFKTKDLDLFCKKGDYPKILNLLSNKGFKTRVPDDNWLAKATKNNALIDIIFSGRNGINPVDDSWLKNSQGAKLFGEAVRLIGPEELIRSKLYVQTDDRFDGPDVNHLILKLGNKLKWQNILQHMEAHWELLLSALINYRFVYPSERDQVPKWLMKELVARQQAQLRAPLPKERICRGPLLSWDRYQKDIIEDGFII